VVRVDEDEVGLGLLDAAPLADRHRHLRQDQHGAVELLDGPDYTAIGIGIVCRNDGRMWATQIFGVPHGAQPVPAPWWSVEPIVRQDPGPACPSAAWTSFGLR
jgi:hypothetical protein